MPFSMPIFNQKCVNIYLIPAQIPIMLPVMPGVQSMLRDTCMSLIKISMLFDTSC